MKSIYMTALALATAFGAPAFAYNGSIVFSASEKATHASKASEIAQSAADCMDAQWLDHVSFFKQHGVSRYFGNRRYIKGEKPGVRADGHPLTPIRPELRKHGVDVSLENELTSMSCVDFARKCLSEAFAASGQSTFWDRIEAFNQFNGNIGPAIAVGLQAIGWKLVYWNPDHAQDKTIDDEDQRLRAGNPGHVWGYHGALFQSSVISPSHHYYQYQVDDFKTLVNFGTHVPQKFLQVPFFMGFANIGYHVFLGYHGQVIEAHSARGLFAMDNMENTEFNPAAGGGPKSTNSEKYHSGLIAVPPGYL